MMKKKSLLIVAILAFVLLFAAPLSAAEKDWTGYTPIATAEDLANIADNPYGNYYLTNDIVFEDADFEEGGAFYNKGAGWIPLGPMIEESFHGIFDGNGYAIENLKVFDNRVGGFTFGLFGFNFGTIRNVTVNGEIISNDKSLPEQTRIGGICAHNYGFVINCVNKINIDAYAICGGITGENFRVINGCKNYGTVTSRLKNEFSSGYAGGIAGYTTDFLLGADKGTYRVYCSYISRSANYGDITSENCAGGIAARSFSYESNEDYRQTIQNCFNTGTISADQFGGGILGKAEDVNIDCCYNNNAVTTNDPQSTRGLMIGAIEENTAMDRCYFGVVNDEDIPIVGNTDDYYDAVYIDPNTPAYHPNDFMEWDFDTIWEKVDGKHFPELCPLSSEDPDSLYISTHKMLFVGERIQLNFETDPLANAAAALIWESSNPEVATVNGGGCVIAEGKGTATITLRTTDGTVKANCEVTVLQEPETTTFNDVSENSWYWAYVDFVSKYGIFNGVGDKVFAPNESMTRAMVVTVLYRIEGSPEVTDMDGYTDVDNGQWYAPAVYWATENGIATGFGGGIFGPNENVTREQFALFLYRYVGWKGFDTSNRANLSAFPDCNNVGEWAKDAIQWAVAEKIINGKPSNGTNYLMPQGYTTRAEVAKMLSVYITETYDFARVRSFNIPGVLTMEQYEQLQLSTNIVPEGALKEVKWGTSNNGIATVNYGLVDAISPGEVTIYATIGDLTSTCKLTVKESSSKYAVSFRATKEFLEKNGTYDSEAHSYYYGYGDNISNWFIEYEIYSKQLLFIYEEDLGNGDWINFTLIISDQNTLYTLLTTAVIDGNYIYTTAWVNANLYHMGDSIFSNYYDGDYSYATAMDEAMTIGLPIVLSAAEMIFEEDLPTVSVKDFGFVYFTYE